MEGRRSGNVIAQGKRQQERSPGSCRRRSASPEGAGQNGLAAAVSPFQGFILLPLGTQASLVPRAAWAITLPGFQPFVVPLSAAPAIRERRRNFPASVPAERREQTDYSLSPKVSRPPPKKPEYRCRNPSFAPKATRMNAQPRNSPTNPSPIKHVRNRQICR